MYRRSESAPPIVLGLAQLLRKRLLFLATIALGVCFVFLGPHWADGDAAHESIEIAGIALIILCILGRTWSSFYIAGRKDVNLVTVGPYSVCRNPLYFFSILGAAGVGAQFGTITGTVVVGVFAWLMFELVVHSEEKSLKGAYGAVYAEYCARVPRFMPRWSQWQGVATLEIDPRRVSRTFADACLFLLAIPIAEALEYLHQSGAVAVLFRIP